MTLYRFRVLLATGVFVLLVFAVLAFGTVDTWALSLFELGTFLLLALASVQMIFAGWRPVWNSLYIPWALLALWTALQALLGISAYVYRTELEALRWLALTAIFFMACQAFADESVRSRFNLALMWFGCGLCVMGLTQYFTARNFIFWLVPVAAGKVFGPFVNANHFTALLELLLPAALLLALRPSPQRLIYVVAASIMLAAVVVCGSRAGTTIVALEAVLILGGTALLPGRSSPRRRPARVLMPAAGLAAVVALCFYVAGAQQILDRFHEEHPYNVRWNVVRDTWALFLHRPWTGYGAGTFSSVYPSATSIDLGLFWPHAHNDPVQFLMEWGILAVLPLGWTVWTVARRRRSRSTWFGVVLPLLAVLAHSWFDFPFQITAVTATWLVLLAQVKPALPNSGDQGLSAVATRVHEERYVHSVS